MTALMPDAYLPARMDQNVKILIVDDLPEKLLVYQTVLEQPGLELVMARSGNEALRHVLQHDFAVILLDVNMPDMDGYETAALIRTRKRSAHTPIIFITAYADELHAIKGYSYGAVDYILSPVVPDVLRTKVRVFVELHRKTLEVQRQAERLRELQALEHRRQLSETNERLRLALEAGRMGACEWSMGSKLLSWSPILETIFEFEPDEFTGSTAMLLERVHADDREWVVNALAHSVETGTDVHIEHRIIRPKSGEGWVELRGTVFMGAGDEPSRLVGVCLDITQRKRIESELERHRAHLEELVRERTAELEESHEKLRLNDRLASIGTLAAGLGHDMGNLLLPIRARLASLEEMALPPAAIEAVQAIKTAGEYLKRLSQGLRLFALDPAQSRPAGAGGSLGDTTVLTRWWVEVEPFLRNALPKGVRLVCDLESEDGVVPPIAIPAHTFTQMIYNLVQNAGDVMRERGAGTVSITARTAKPPLRPGSGLANADGRLTADAQRITIEVDDDGPGMTEEVRQRCMDPFFTTRPRGISTGLGLALVRSAVMNAHGSIEIDSLRGKGTTFRIILPAATSAAALASADRDASAQPLTDACIALKDVRLAAYVSSLLGNSGVRVLAEESAAAAAESAAQLLVIDSLNGQWQQVERFLSDDPARRVLLIGEVPPIQHHRLSHMSSKPNPAQLREALQKIIAGVSPAAALLQEVPS